MGTLKITSSAFKEGEPIPRKFGYENGNVSPPLTILVPAGTRSVALIMDDPDALEAVGKVWVHWVIYNMDTNSILKGDIRNIQIPEGNAITKPLTTKQFANAKDEKMQAANKTYLIQCQEKRYGMDTLWGGLVGPNDWGEFDYGGPAPPSGTHTYRFKAYALKTPHLNLPRFDRDEEVMRPGTKADVKNDIEDQIIEEATLTGTYYAD
jgi:hypothetical protein